MSYFRLDDDIETARKKQDKCAKENNPKRVVFSQTLKPFKISLKLLRNMVTVNRIVPLVSKIYSNIELVTY